MARHDDASIRLKESLDRTDSGSRNNSSNITWNIRGMWSKVGSWGSTSIPDRSELASPTGADTGTSVASWERRALSSISLAVRRPNEKNLTRIDPVSWEKAEEFCPERFAHNYVDFKGQDFELIPFGAGRRSYPGIAFGISSIELALANLLYWFNWEFPRV
ncbi:Cytochrome P450 71A1 [Cinnamomum micranthum f. kanehirae]|uniref:Cytochrome P450 71A1 n=1 Tax=Cinnamomum micranthum f. kanehirae TaxID=337451 RepID=A0A3S3NFD7_9MAGN|nr:Cytochrome P450 71A1 [Cinnamomum micranthum f. kanehirae]